MKCFYMAMHSSLQVSLAPNALFNSFIISQNNKFLTERFNLMIEHIPEKFLWNFTAPRKPFITKEKRHNIGLVHNFNAFFMISNEAQNIESYMQR